MNSDSGRLIDERQARQKAQETLAFEIGNLPRLGEVETTDSAYIFPLEIRLPRIIFDADRESPVDVKFMSSEPLGKIRVDAATGEVERSHIHEIESQIRQKRKQIETTVQKALVRASAEEFSRLPFPEHRYTPILDILSHLIIEGPITAGELAEMKSMDEQKYREYIEMLEDTSLVRWENERVEADNVLIELQAEESRPPKLLNASMAHFFEEGAENIEAIRGILGPHLVISGHYYRRALELDNLPRMQEDEFDEVMRWNYTGNDRVQKRFKLSRYLIQLENVGLLRSENGTGPREWYGTTEAKRNLLRQDDLLDPISEVIA